MNTRMLLTVITGFLGSGKTTIVREFLRRPGFHNTAVIINEFGDIGIDHDLIESSREDLISLSTGCLCCAMQGDLAQTVRRLMVGVREADKFCKRSRAASLPRPAPVLPPLHVPSPLLHVPSPLLNDTSLRS
ncbi:hypothetical protein C2W62_29785 [Candidatus Entotheonella serta]|nr:hypothetical protein C2W62_29785 [Candidatus Entotheonella serta]